MANQRGLVISCPITLKAVSIYIKSGALDPQELRFALLFWDKLDFPFNPIFPIGLEGDAQFLASEGILRRTNVQDPGSGDMAGDAQFLASTVTLRRITVGPGVVDMRPQAITQAHVDAYRFLDKQEPGVWSLGTGENAISFPDDDIEDGRGALIRLYQAIPVPDKDVPFQDILEFRSKRSAELLALRHHLEAIYQRIVAAGDGALALNTEIGALEQAIADHIKASKESKMSFRNMSFDASLNVPVGVVAGLTALTVELTLVQSLLAGVGAAFGFGPGISLKSRTTAPTPFQYISSYHEKVF